MTERKWSPERSCCRRAGESRSFVASLLRMTERKVVTLSEAVVILSEAKDLLRKAGKSRSFVASLLRMTEREVVTLSEAVVILSEAKDLLSTGPERRPR